MTVVVDDMVWVAINEIQSSGYSRETVVKVVDIYGSCNMIPRNVVVISPFLRPLRTCGLMARRRGLPFNRL